jgi:arylsulfatase A-like enzyme
MRTVFVMFDSLNRHMLGPYGGTAVPTPNFDRLAQRAVTFEKHYPGSLPCMPARKDIQTGRVAFLHRSWAPMEPYDNSVFDILAETGTYSHLVTDHHHYFEDGGATYHNRYDSYEFVRGQEGDRWKAMVAPDWERLRQKYDPKQFSTNRRNYRSTNVVNREYVHTEAEFPSAQCFAHGLDFLDTNRDADDWILQLETFDPHEPFTAPDRFREQFRTGWNQGIRDWPAYGRMGYPQGEADELRASYFATVAHCDHLLGTLLDYFDAHDMWKDTALIVTTDHGFLLGEHEYWAKNRTILYEELVHLPLFVHDPRSPREGGRRSDALTQTIDVAATLLELHGGERPPEMQGISLLSGLDGDPGLRKGVIFGLFGGAVNVTDGRYTYHRSPQNYDEQEIYQYTLMPTHLKSLFGLEELRTATLSPPLSFTKGCPVLKIRFDQRSPIYNMYGPGILIETENRLFDLEADPGQVTPLEDAATEARLAALMAALMTENDAPPEAFARLALEPLH